MTSCQLLPRSRPVTWTPTVATSWAPILMVSCVLEPLLPSPPKVRKNPKVTIVCSGAGFETLYPGLESRLLTLQGQFAQPGWNREMLYW